MDNILDGMSMNIEKTEREKLMMVFPQCFVEDKLDIDKLLNMCGEYITNDFEKYKFEWKGKSECLQLAQRLSTGTLRPKLEESVNFDATKNVYIKGDNLEVLKLLQTAYYRQVKMIYIDPPYNTGNDFVYVDNFADPLARYKEVTAQTTKSNPETMGRFHTNWLNMMYPRLRLAANLLRDDGVCFISIDDNEVHNLRKLCDEVFGEENFVASVIWEKKYSPANDAKWLSDNHDYILIYAKKKDVWHPQLLPRSDEQNNRYTNRDNDPRGDWKPADMTVKSYSASYDYPITTPSGRTVNPSEGRCWNTSKENFEKLVADNRIWFGENGDNLPAVKKFLTEVKDGVVPLTIWKYEEVGHNQEGRQELKKLFNDKGYFDGPKPVRLLNKILRIANLSDNDIILDFFSGSATTAHAVMQLNAVDGGNRQFIMVQLPELCDEESEAFKAGYNTICDIGMERIRRAGSKLKDALEKDGGDFRHLVKHINDSPQKTFFSDDSEQAFTVPIIPARWSAADENQENQEMANKLDVGFKVFELETSNLKTWDGTPVTENEQQELIERMNHMLDRVKPDRTDLDMVYEIMLKMGVPLDYSVNPIEIDGKVAYAIGDDCMLLVCLAEGVTSENIEELATYAPAKMILGKNTLKNATAMANAYYILKDRFIELKLV